VQQVLAVIEAGVWQCAHGGYPNRSLLKFIFQHPLAKIEERLCVPVFDSLKPELLKVVKATDVMIQKE
jgi:hypothetical protein